jgi:HlyD family secretion protein
MNPTSLPFPAAKNSGASAWRRRLPWLGGALLVALVVAGLWPRPAPVEVAIVTRGPLVVTVDEEGMTRVRNRYVVSAPVAGHLRRIDWKAGAPVEAGQTVLAVVEGGGADFLDARTQAQAAAHVNAASAARDAAAAQRARATAAAKMFTADFARLKELFGQKALSLQEFEAAQMRADTAEQDERAAEFALKVADYELEQARAVLGRGTIASASAGPTGTMVDAAPMALTSPVGGKILRVLQESERMVPAGFSLMEIGDPADLEARIEVLSRDGVAIRPGARVMLERWGGPEPLAARVRLVEPAAFTKISALGVEEQRVYVVVDFTDPLEKRATLGDGYRVEARIVTWESSNVLRASAGALFQRGTKWQAFVLENGFARLRDVQVGHSNGIMTEIVGGLREDDIVIVYPGDKVAEGARVTPLELEKR